MVNDSNCLAQLRCLLSHWTASNYDKVIFGNSHCSTPSALPPAAECLIELDYAQQLVQPDLPEVQLRLEQIAVGVKRIELGIHTADISCIRLPFPIFKSCDQRLLLHSALPHSLVSNQGVRYFGEGSLDGLLILTERTISLGFRQSYVGTETAGREYRLGDLRGKTPRAVWTPEQAS